MAFILETNQKKKYNSKFSSKKQEKKKEKDESLGKKLAEVYVIFLKLNKGEKI